MARPRGACSGCKFVGHEERLFCVKCDRPLEESRYAKYAWISLVIGFGIALLLRAGGASDGNLALS